MEFHKITIDYTWSKYYFEIIGFCISKFVWVEIIFLILFYCLYKIYKFPILYTSVGFKYNYIFP